MAYKPMNEWLADAEMVLRDAMDSWMEDPTESNLKRLDRALRAYKKARAEATQ